MNFSRTIFRLASPTGGLLTTLGLAAVLVSGCAPGYSGQGSIQALGGGGSTEPTVAIKLDAAAQTEAAGPAGGAAVVAGYGTVSGHVVLEGGAPTLNPLLPGGELRDPTVCVRAQIPDYRVIVGPEGGLANVFVYLPRKPAGAKDIPPSPAEPVRFDQKTCSFVPHALLVRAKQEVMIHNSDPIAHNTHTDNGAFNSNVAPNNPVPLIYARGERAPVRVTCDFHTWMLAWHLPLDHPYGALTGPDGSFTISDVPAGKHKFVAYHEGRKVGDYTLEITPDQTTPLEIKVQSSSLAQRTDPDATKSVILSFGAP